MRQKKPTELLQYSTVKYILVQYIIKYISRPHYYNNTVLTVVVGMYGHHIYSSKSTEQPGKIVNPARGQLNRGNEYFPVPVRA